jgi:hypothetical protein
LQVDAWQVAVLEGWQRRLLVNTCRWAGKSTVAGLLALRNSLALPGLPVVLLARSHHQAALMFERLCALHARLGAPLLRERGAGKLVLANGSRLLCLPARDHALRDWERIGLLIVDDAARVAEDLYRAATVRVAAAAGRIVALSVPLGPHGFFYEAWARGGPGWSRLEVPAAQLRRLAMPEWSRRRQVLGEAWYRQEFCCAFEPVVGLIYPDFGRCVVAELLPPGRWLGGIDFGVRNPLAAVWGVRDAAGVLWLSGEHYQRERPLAYHAERLPRDVTWYADPSGAREILELRCLGLRIQRGNWRRATLGQVRAWLLGGRLRVLAGCCPYLLAEASQYRLDPAAGFRRPVKENDHALDALRYLVSRADEEP